MIKFPTWLLTWKAALASAGLAAAIAGASAGRVVYLVEHGKLTTLQADVRRQDADRRAQIAEAAASSIKAQGEISLRSAETHAAAKAEIITQIRDVIHEVPVYVTPAQDRVACVSFGFVRVLNSAAEGRNPADYQLPAGVTDDTCTDLEASAVAAGIADNYGAARLNARQLDDLIDDVLDRIDVANCGSDGVTSRDNGVPDCNNWPPRR